MKKILLTLIAVASVVMMAKAQSTLSYGICSDEINAVGTGTAGTNYSAAIEVPEAMAEAMKGNKLTQMHIGIGSGMSKNLTLYLSYDLQGEPFYTQDATWKGPNSEQHYTLDTPYVIEGKKFYIGYKYRQSSSSGMPIGFDGNPLNGLSQFSHLGVWADNAADKAEWGVYTQYGALSIRATIEGDNMPVAVIPIRLSLPDAVGENKDFEYKLDVYNMSCESVNKLEISSIIGTQSPQNEVVTLGSPLAPGATTTITVKGKSAEENLETPFKVNVLNVDDKVNAWDCAAISTLLVSNSVVPRVVVVEEFTGVDCVWCPAGYVAMEQMREKYPDDYIGIAVHNYKYPDDPMKCGSYRDWVSKYVTGAPQATINRNSEIGVFSPTPETIEKYYKSERQMTGIDLNINAKYAGESKEEILVTTDVAFDYDIDSHSYGFALVQTEDNVGPYTQQNAYSGGRFGEMGGFENEGVMVKLIFNDVARLIMGWDGTLGNLPDKIIKGERYEFTETMTLRPEVVLKENGKPDVDKQQKHGDTNVIALLIDRKDGHIVTAAKCRIEGTVSGVQQVVHTPDVWVSTVAGGISVAGEFDAAEVYTIDGKKVASLERAGAVSMAPGIYVVRVLASGETLARKVAVK